MFTWGKFHLWLVASETRMNPRAPLTLVDILL